MSLQSLVINRNILLMWMCRWKFSALKS